MLQIGVLTLYPLFLMVIFSPSRTGLGLFEVVLFTKPSYIYKITLIKNKKELG